MKKILCLIDGLTLGGAERQLIGLSSMLQKQGYHVDLAYYYKMNFYEDLVRSENLNTVFIDVKGSRLAKLLGIYKFVKQGKYDVIIAYKNGPASIACLLKRLGLKFKLIVSERNTNTEVTLQDSVKFFLYKWADYVVPNSYSQEKFVSEKFVSLVGKTVVITNFTDISHFMPKPNVDSKDDTKFKILSVGRIAKQKNILNYMQAAKRIVSKYPYVSFEWIGDVQSGEEQYLSRCVETLHKLQLGNSFFFKPATHHILEEYHNCDIFCLPSNYEGFPNVICEAMSCGKPILCSNVCDNPYIVKDGVNGYLFDPSNIDDMVLKTESMLNLAAENRRTMSKESRNMAERLFSESTFKSKYIELIES